LYITIAFYVVCVGLKLKARSCVVCCRNGVKNDNYWCLWLCSILVLRQCFSTS